MLVPDALRRLLRAARQAAQAHPQGQPGGRARTRSAPSPETRRWPRSGASTDEVPRGVRPLRKLKLEPPVRSNRPGTTRRLLNINSVSVRMKNAPTSSIHRVAGQADLYAERRFTQNVRIKLRLRTTDSAKARFTAPSRSLAPRSVEVWTAFKKSTYRESTRQIACHHPPRDRPIRGGKERARVWKDSPPRSGVIVIAARMGDLPRTRRGNFEASMLPRAFATSIENRHVSNQPVRFVAPEDACELVVGRVQ